MTPRAYVESFAGSAAVALSLLRGVPPPISYMGGKRRLAPWVLAAVGLRPRAGAARVVLTDAGEWGRVWTVVAEGHGEAVCRLLEAWDSPDPFALWDRLAGGGPPADPVERAATYLWLQARSASATPVWWDDDGKLVMPEKPRRGVSVLKAPVQRCRFRTPVAAGRCSGIVRTSTVAARLRAASAALTSTSTTVGAHLLWPDEVAELLGTPGDLAGVVWYDDPPYVGCTRYEGECPREVVVARALRAAELGAVVAVSEAEPIEALGWDAVDLSPATEQRTRGCKREWLTVSAPALVKPGRQLALACCA